MTPAELRAWAEQRAREALDSAVLRFEDGTTLERATKASGAIVALVDEVTAALLEAMQKAAEVMDEWTWHSLGCPARNAIADEESCVCGLTEARRFAREIGGE